MVGYYYDSFGNGTVVVEGATCKACSPACIDGYFEEQACDAELNTNRVCTACSTCVSGTFANGGCDKQANVDTICTGFSSCKEGTYETAAGTLLSDRECSFCSGCGGNTFQGSGCCSTLDSVCHTLTVCGDDEFEVSPPQLAPIGQSGFNSDRRCRKTKQCGSGEYEVAGPTPSSDRDCRICDDCAGQKLVTECKAGGPSENTICEDYDRCPENFWMSRPGSPSLPPACSKCTVCSAAEYDAGTITHALCATFPLGVCVGALLTSHWCGHIPVIFINQSCSCTISFCGRRYDFSNHGRRPVPNFCVPFLTPPAFFCGLTWRFCWVCRWMRWIR